MKFKIGDKVKPKKEYPGLKGKIVKIKKDTFTGEILYILDNRCRYLAEELEQVKSK